MNIIKNTATLVLSRNRVNVVESRIVWHRWLGYPSPKVLDYILRGCNSATKSNE